MPVIDCSKYVSPVWLRKGHLSTIYAAVLKKVSPPEYSREKLFLPDGDFIFNDYILRNSQRAVILCHGLEGHSKSYYMNSCAHYFLERNYSVFAWNNRSCSGEMNLLPQLYHHGSVDDLEFVIRSVAAWGFAEIYLVGFSLGGAQILNYLGQRSVEKQVKAAVVISTPIDLRSSFEKINHGFSSLYEHRLVKSLKKKIVSKSLRFPRLLNYDKVKSIRHFKDVAAYYLSPVYGFKNLGDYCDKASPDRHLKNIRTPVLILNAANDPIIGKKAYPIAIAQNSRYVYLESPKYGGHCALPIQHSKYAYSEIRAAEFFEERR